MRLAFFSPLPPAKSGIADYSAALLDWLTHHAAIDVYTQPEPDFDPAGLDGILYQLGNNPHHSFVYEQALKTPGIVVMHEANLHHLIADITIRRDRWDLYAARGRIERRRRRSGLALARQAPRGRSGLRGLPMTRRLLERCPGRHRAQPIRPRESCGDRAIAGPLAVIPHGAWMPEANRLGRAAEARDRRRAIR